MQINPLDLHLSHLTVQKHAEASNNQINWQLGQQLKATVTGYAGNSRVRLQIDNHTLNARTSLSLTVGQTLQLKVDHHQQQLVLKTTNELNQLNLIAHGIKSALPRQDGLGTFACEPSSNTTIKHSCTATARWVN